MDTVPTQTAKSEDIPENKPQEKSKTARDRVAALSDAKSYPQGYPQVTYYCG
jgi:hypothetical protein